jgi:hypothetical protein
MKRVFGLIQCLLIFSLVGCARNVLINYPTSPWPEETGTLVIKLSAPMNDVSVTIDGNFVVEEKHTQRIQVNGIRAGEREVNIVGGGNREHLDKTETVEISPAKTTAMLVKAPSYSTGYYIYAGVIFLAFTLGNVFTQSSD